MILTLRVLSEQGQGLPKNASKSFFETAATVGRRGDNDWVLPDPSRLVSGKHASIDFEDDSYYLTDTSTNGTFINSPDRPIGRGNRVELHDGDRLYVGDYVMEVSIESAAGVSPERPMQDLGGSLDEGFMPDYDRVSDDEPTNSQLPLPEQFQADRTGGLGTQRDDIPVTGEQFQPPEAIPEDIILDDEATLGDEPVPTQELLQTEEMIPTDWDLLGNQEAKPEGPAEDLSAEPFAPATAEPGWETPAAEEPPMVGQLPDHEVSPAPPVQAEAVTVVPPVERPSVQQAPAAPPPAPSARTEPEAPREQAPTAPPVAPSARAEPKAPREQAPTAPTEPATRTFDPVAELLQGAGLEAMDLSDEATKELVRVVGGVFRETVRGLYEALRARAEFKRGFRVQQTVIRPVENNPLKFAVGNVEERMQTLLFRKGSGYMPPVDAVQEGFKDLEAHQLAMVVGMKAALQLLLNRFDPAGLEKQLEERGGRTHVLPMTKKAKLWEQYLRLYQALSRDIEDDFQAVFGNEFCSAYEQQVRSIESARKKHSGGDQASAR